MSDDSNSDVPKEKIINPKLALAMALGFIAANSYPSLPLHEPSMPDFAPREQSFYRIPRTECPSPADLKKRRKRHQQRASRRANRR